MQVILKIAIFGHEIWPFKVSKVAHIFSFHPMGSKSSFPAPYGPVLSKKIQSAIIIAILADRQKVIAYVIPLLLYFV